MSKKARKKSASDSPSRIADPASFVDMCIPLLREHFQNQNLAFNPTPRARNVVHFELSGPGQQSATARETYAVHQIPVPADELYWAAVNLELTFTNPYHALTSVQLVVFRGPAWQNKEPYFRAEWHCSDEDLRASHAQPHWHIYVPPTQNSQRILEFAPVRHFDPAPNATLAASKFHFAMAANWHVAGAGAHKSSLETSAALCNWLDGCLRYIREQLQ